MIQSFIIAFSMYSKIPMPTIEWNKENMKYALGFFPLVGAAIGAVLSLWCYIADKLNIGSVLFAAVATVIPVLITGGIHLDGFCDTVDAKSSHQIMERKLEILKDPHIGAFALIYSMVYFVVNFGLWTEFNISVKNVLLISLGFVLSRAFSGLAIVTFKCAKNSGLAYMFASGAEKKKVRNIMAVYIIAAAVAALIINPIIGALVIIAILLTFIYYKQMSYKQFGGITGDLAGYFLQIAELALLAVIVLAGGVR